LVFGLFRDGRFDGILKVIKIVRDEVRQVGVLRVVPALLDRVQFGSIRWQGLEREPVGMVFLEVRRRGAMHVPAIPDHDHVMAVMAVQETEEPHQVVRVDVFRQQMEIER
jgi:hypothetical protein